MNKRPINDSTIAFFTQVFLIFPSGNITYDGELNSQWSISARLTAPAAVVPTRVPCPLLVTSTSFSAESISPIKRHNSSTVVGIFTWPGLLKLIDDPFVCCAGVFCEFVDVSTVVYSVPEILEDCQQIIKYGKMAVFKTRTTTRFYCLQRKAIHQWLSPKPLTAL